MSDGAAASSAAESGSALTLGTKFGVTSTVLVVAASAGGGLLYLGGGDGLSASALAGGGVLLLSLSLFVGLTYRGVTQVQRVAASATAVSQGDLDREVALDRADELGQLSASVDDLRRTLRERAERDGDGDGQASGATQPASTDATELETRAREFSEIAAQCADGDFTRRMDADGDNEAMNEVAEQFNRMMVEIEETIVDLQRFAQNVATASEEVNGAAQDVRASSREVAASVRSVIGETEESLDAVSGEMEGLSTMTQQIASSSNQVAQLSRRTAQTGREGREAAQSAIYGLDEIREQSGAAVDEIDDLREEMAQIDDLLEFITSIAERTNMLALNANIEASRGGGADSEGFGVVAEEIRELADDTKETAGEIEKRLERLQAQTDTAAQKVEGTRDEVEAHADAVENAIDALDEIAEYAEETNTGIQEINAATEQQAAAAEEVVAIVDDTQSTIDETVSEARNVVDAAENQARVLDAVADNTTELSDQARWLDDTLSMFRVSSAAKDSQRIGDAAADLADIQSTGTADRPTATAGADGTGGSADTTSAGADATGPAGGDPAATATHAPAAGGSDATPGAGETGAAAAAAGGARTQFATGHAAGGFAESHEVGAAAATQAFDDLDADRADFCQVFVSPEYDYGEVLAGIREVVGGDTRLIGCSTSGEFTERAAKSGSVALSLVTSEDMDFHVGLGENLSGNVTGAVEDAIGGFPADVDRPHLAAINLHDGLAGVGNQIALVTQRKLGREVATAGGSAADDLQMQETVVFVGDESGDRVGTDALAMALIASERPVVTSVDHGHEPVSQTFTVTRAEGGTVHELDGRPAFEVYREAIRDQAAEVLGVDVDTVEPGTEEWATMTGVFEFGIVSDAGDGVDNRVRWPGLTETTDGPMDFAVQIPEGEQVRVMFGDEDEQVEAAARVAGDAVSRAGAGGAAGAFVYECACRSMILGEEFDRAVDALDGALGVPFAGLETYGELCMQEGQDSGYHNTTSVVMLLPA